MPNCPWCVYFCQGGSQISICTDFCVHVDMSFSCLDIACEIAFFRNFIFENVGSQISISMEFCFYVHISFSCLDIAFEISFFLQISHLKTQQAHVSLLILAISHFALMLGENGYLLGSSVPCRRTSTGGELSALRSIRCVNGGMFQRWTRALLRRWAV